jgi:hypothetical protein
MADAVFVDGIPAKITIHDFRRYCLQSFPTLAASDYDNLLTEAIDTVYAMFAGIGELWDMQPRQTWYDKTVLCYRLLAAWYITDRYPELSRNYTSLNGVRLEQKKVDGVMLKFQKAPTETNVDPMLALQSNDFGRKALFMIKTAAKRALLRNRRIV